MPGIRDLLYRSIGSMIRLSLMGGSALWAWTRLKSDMMRIKESASGIGKKITDSTIEYGSRGASTLSTSAKRIAKSAPNALTTVKKQKEAIMGKPKKKFSFLKFLLVMGAMIALAIFLLDKFLPKPYRDDELEDAWAGEDLEPSEAESVSSDISPIDEADEVEGSDEVDEDKD
ncbi:MAG TPA: hypothetical protein ENH10_00050 [Bacteroidetes bacterium]|nr:hypothetical protein BMS3Bbin04_01240 [bacterium BMS3Bbin04]HDO64412.1 hypothetical protein [Bacteroidota bacterium]HEX03537.1 hypothetical protein [Bacteroidota bacterium]